MIECVWGRGRGGRGGDRMCVRVYVYACMRVCV